MELTIEYFIVIFYVDERVLINVMEIVFAVSVINYVKIKRRINKTYAFVKSFCRQKIFYYAIIFISNEGKEIPSKDKESIVCIGKI